MDTTSHLDPFPIHYTVNSKALVWKFPKKLPVIGGFTLYGNSWACHQTAFQIPELSWTLDVGFVPHPQRRSHVFVTHAHGDHSTSLPFMISRHCPPTIFLPASAKDCCIDYLETHLKFRLHGQGVGELLPSYYVKGVEAGQKFKLEGKNNTDKVIEVFPMDHSVVCVGYGFSIEKKRLKPEYASLPGKELGALRKQGISLDEFYEIPAFAFLGDTTTKFFEEQSALEKKDQPNIFRFPLIITECTFLGLEEEDSARAQKTKHVFWPDLKPFVVAHPDIIFVLIHFSLRCSPSVIRNFFKGENLSNVVAFVEGESATLLQEAQHEVEEM